MPELTDYQARMMDLLRRFREQRGNPFTASDEGLARDSGFLLTSGVNRLLRHLEAQGLIRRSGRKPRTIEILD